MESIKCSTGYRPELRTLKFQFCLPFGLISDILQIRIWGVSPMLSPFPLLPLPPLPPKIIFHIILAVLYTFLMVLTRRICLTIRSVLHR